MEVMIKNQGRAWHVLQQTHFICLIEGLADWLTEPGKRKRKTESLRRFKNINASDSVYLG